MFERFFEKETSGTLKGMTLEWNCPHCGGKNFRLVMKADRGTGTYHNPCRYCQTRCRVIFNPANASPEGEEDFLDRLSEEHFSAEEQQDLIRDFAEIEYLRFENPGNREIAGKRRLLEEKIAFLRRRRR